MDKDRDLDANESMLIYKKKDNSMNGAEGPIKDAIFKRFLQTDIR